jgi:epoxyqueuosine reductase
MVNTDNKKKSKLILHICCAPCSTAVIEKLKETYKVIGFYYNPNIYPESEYFKRLVEVRKYCKIAEIDLMECTYDHKEWKEKIRGLEEEKEGGKRCVECFKLRMDETAKEAKNKNLDYFTTTLSVSPYKNFIDISRIGKDFEKINLIKFLNSDFKKRDGYKRSIELSKKYKLYRQKYCGCEFSKKI